MCCVVFLENPSVCRARLLHVIDLNVESGQMVGEIIGTGSGERQN